MKPLSDIDADHFKQFGEYLKVNSKVVSKRDSEAFLQLQKKQVETLVKLEKDFKIALLSNKKGIDTYEKFIYFIRDQRKNILAARPFFRERQTVFTNKIAKALKKRSWQELSKFHFNFNFIRFVMNTKKWGKTTDIVKIHGEIVKLRHQLVVMNMPLAVSRVSMFYRSTPRSQLSYMDLIQTAAEGLMIAIDKFCLPFSKVFRAVAIGRILGLIIESYNQPILHFFPGDKRKIYKANKILNKDREGINYTDLSKKINKTIDKIYKTNPTELMNLMAAASNVSSDNELKNENNNIIKTNTFAAPVESRPDFKVERQDSYTKLYEAVSKLSILEQKILKLKGIEF